MGATYDSKVPKRTAKTNKAIEMKTNSWPSSEEWADINKTYAQENKRRKRKI